MWQVVLPLKGTDDAKSRLDLSRTTRHQMVGAMAADTLTALLATPEVHKVSVLSRRPDPLVPSPVAREAEVIVQPERLTSLDQALAWFAHTHAASSTHLAIVVADLPALRPESMTSVLTDAARHHLAMVADASGTGTTILTTCSPARLPTHFGAGSAAAHQAAGAALISGTPDTQCDVDTTDDLDRAREIGLGPHMLALLSKSELAR
ncbi:MAG: 2-phospho-L-lactate guanylyltransferase [Actinomycetes bacterium]